VSTRRFAAIVAATLTIGTAILAAGPAHADHVARAAPRGTAELPGARRGPAGVAQRVLTPVQVAKRAEVAKRAGVSVTSLDGPYHIVNRNSGKCLTILNVSTADNANAVQYTCDYSYPYNEEWYLEFVF
jgi:Ricin-type beta-trefoil lectin domain-like